MDPVGLMSRGVGEPTKEERHLAIWAALRDGYALSASIARTMETVA